MKVTPSILQNEFIGTETRVALSSNPVCKGISGKVLDETRNTFTIMHGTRPKIVIKERSIFRFTLSDGTEIEVDGKMLVGRPEDRAKKVARRRW